MAEGIVLMVDTKAVNQMLRDCKLTTAEARRALRRGLNESGRMIQAEARRKLSGVATKNGKLKAMPLRRFVKVSVYKNLTGVRVDIFGGSTKRQQAAMKAKGTKDLGWTLKFFESGTQNRFNKVSRRNGYKRLKRERYTGRIEASHFFSNAVREKDAGAQMMLQSFIEKHINRIAAKHRG